MNYKVFLSNFITIAYMGSLVYISGQKYITDVGAACMHAWELVFVVFPDVRYYVTAALR